MQPDLINLYTAILRVIGNNDQITKDLVYKLVDNCFDVLDNIQKAID